MEACRIFQHTLFPEPVWPTNMVECLVKYQFVNNEVLSHNVSYIILRETSTFQHEAEIFLCENAAMFPHLQKHSQVNSFKTESKERWTALDNLHELMTAPYKNVLFCLQFNCLINVRTNTGRDVFILQ